MQKIVYFDYCALFIFVIILTATLFQKMTKGRKNAYYLAMVITSIIAVVADLVAVNLDKSGGGNILAKYISHTVYLAVHNMISLLYLMYLIARTDTWYRLKISNFFKGLLFIPLIIVLGAIITNPFTNYIFYFDAAGTYTRGKYMLFLYAAAIFYAVFGMSFLLHYRRLFNKSSLVLLACVIPFVMIAALIQLLWPWCIVEMFATAYGLLFISMMVQRPEDAIDSITGLGRESVYLEDMKRAFANGKPMDIIMVNISNYHEVFDMVGLDDINRLMRNVGDMFSEINRTKGIKADLYSLGNGKFRIVIDYRYLSVIDDIAENVNDIMKQEYFINGMSISLISYVCIVECPDNISDINSLLVFGNDLYKRPCTGEVIRAGEICKSEYYKIMRNINSIIDKAIVNRRFEVYYQPIYSIKERRYNSAEALIRLNDDEYGFISPEIFIPVAEKSGAIHKIGMYVLEEVCRFISSDEFKKLNIDYIEINLSVAQCMQNNLSKNILDMLNRYNVSVNQINLEITESLAADSQKIMIENLNTLSEAGISFSLDDFGTGYSNIKRIASLPLEIIKIDRSFTMFEDNKNLEIALKNSINMIKAMNMKIVVEGIETEELVKYFSELQCEYIQGYFFSKPIPKDEFVRFITKSVGEA